MKVPKLESGNSEIAAGTSENNGAQEDANRRFSDSHNTTDRKLKLERRVQRDRRIDAIILYNGPSRRKTIDQRTILNDRRETH